jgi:hypothetical protein
MGAVTLQVVEEGGHESPGTSRETLYRAGCRGQRIALAIGDEHLQKTSALADVYPSVD